MSMFMVIFVPINREAMRTGRPVVETTPYKIIVHTNNGYRYASTKIRWVGEDGKIRYRHKHWGTVDENNRFHPNATYLTEAPAERKKLIFPEGWDLSEIKDMSGNKAPGRVAYQKGDVDRQYGPTWFLDNVARETGLRDDLMKVFDGNREKVDMLLTMAYFPFVDNLSYNHLAQWQREVKAPSAVPLTSTLITRVCQSITEAERMALFKLRAARIGKDELCAVDSTSISSYGFNLVDIRWGRNKEKLPLRQTVEVVVYSLTSHMPIFYLELPGNMPDSRTIELIMKELNDAGFKNLILITDRGYESMKNLELYISRRQKVITSVKVGQGEVLRHIKDIDLTQGYPKGMEYSPEEKLFYQQYDGEYSVKGNGDNVIEAVKLKINLYFSVKARAEAIDTLQTGLSEQKSDIVAIKETGEAVVDKDALRRHCCLLDIVFDSEGHIESWSVNEKKISERMLTAGFFASKTIGVDWTALEALDNYGMRDEQEKCFQLQKGPIGQDRLRTWSETARRGRMFVCFLGLILASYVRHGWQSSELLRKKFGSTESVLEEMRTIRCIEHDGRAKFITPFVGAQVDICREFGFDIPDGCAPTYTSKAKAAKPRRGRPAKPRTEAQEI